LYGRDNVTESDLPHRTKLIQLIFKAYEDEHRKLLDDFKVSQPSSLFANSLLIFLIYSRLLAVFHLRLIAGVTQTLRLSLL
jgi:hypothetical protein